MRIDLLCGAQSLSRAGRVPFPTERDEGTAIGPFGRAILLILLEQPLQLIVQFQIEEHRGQPITNALVIVRIESQHLAAVFGRFFAPPRRPQAVYKSFASPHVGPGWQKSPEVALVFLKSLFAQRALAGGDTSLI